MAKTQKATEVPATPIGAAPEVAPRPVPNGEGTAGWAETVSGALISTVQVARDLLPGRIPVFLGTTALIVTGLIDAPVALGAGLALEALRRWEPRRAG